MPSSSEKEREASEALWALLYDLDQMLTSGNTGTMKRLVYYQRRLVRVQLMLLGEWEGDVREGEV